MGAEGAGAFRYSADEAVDSIHLGETLLSTAGFSTCHHSIISTNSHFHDLDVSSALGLALDELVETLERARLHKTDCLPLGAHGILALNLLHECQYAVFNCASSRLLLAVRLCLGCVLDGLLEYRGGAADSQLHLHACNWNRLVCNKSLHGKQRLRLSRLCCHNATPLGQYCGLGLLVPIGSLCTYLMFLLLGLCLRAQLV